MALKLWDKTKAIYLANGEKADPETVMQKWPFARHFPVVLETSGPLVMAIDALPVLAEMHGIDDTLSEQEQLEVLIVVKQAEQALAAAMSAAMSAAPPAAAE